MNITFIIDETRILIPVKMVYEQVNKDEIANIHYEVNIGNHRLIADSSDVTEFAVKNLRKVLVPLYISIACCQSCRHGNFNPYGDIDNEIFCLKDFKPSDRGEVCQIFSDSRNSGLHRVRCRKLLDFCTDYKPMSHDEYYTYNDWG